MNVLALIHVRPTHNPGEAIRPIHFPAQSTPSRPTRATPGPALHKICAKKSPETGPRTGPRPGPRSAALWAGQVKPLGAILGAPAARPQDAAEWNPAAWPVRSSQTPTRKEVITDEIHDQVQPPRGGH